MCVNRGGEDWIVMIMLLMNVIGKLLIHYKKNYISLYKKIYKDKNFITWNILVRETILTKEPVFNNESSTLEA